MQRPYTLSCHCGAVRLQVDAELASLHECNCSTCARSGFLHWRVPVEAVTLLTRKRARTAYHWRDADGGHEFCPVCGTGLLRTGYRDQISINARCIEGIDVFALQIGRYDGRHPMRLHSHQRSTRTEIPIFPAVSAPDDVRGLAIR